MRTSPRDHMVDYLALTCLLLQMVTAFKMFQKEIPNGHRVPDPCHPGETWRGVGHRVPGGMGTRNPFGEDFAREGKKWTKSLCRMDSDGDGITNGEELGDPQCVWTKGWKPTHSVNITHPGICDPWDSMKCQAQNGWLRCAGTGLNCPVVQEKDTLHTVFRFPETEIPAIDTNYFCQLFDLPADADYHLVATEPIIDNTDIVHHILLFGCNPSVDIPSTPAPYRCDMLPHRNCLDIIGTWTVGSDGDCLQDDVGFRIGKTGYRSAALQIHWNNPELTANATDSSGLKVHYTKANRQHDAGMLLVGQEFLELTPDADKDDDGNNSTITFSQTCPSRCTREMFSTPIYITTTINHMHYRGISQRIELLRDGIKVRDITYDRYYNYDSPVIYTFDPPIEVLPGDEIKTTCVFKPTDGGNPVCFGAGTRDEMCYGFVTYYPKQELRIPWCTARKSTQKCDRILEKFRTKPIDNCHWALFPNRGNDSVEVFRPLLANCLDKDRGTFTCTGNCSAAIAVARKHPCLSGDIGSYVMQRLMRFQEGLMFLEALFTCDCDKQFQNTYCEKRYGSGILGEKTTRVCAERHTGVHEGNTSSKHIYSSICLYSSIILTVLFLKRS